MIPPDLSIRTNSIWMYIIFRRLNVILNQFWPIKVGMKIPTKSAKKFVDLLEKLAKGSAFGFFSPKISGIANLLLLLVVVVVSEND